MEDLKLELITIPTDSIEPNDYNPNIMLDKDMEQLKKAIIREGYNQNIIVRPHETEPNKYIIIDGEHRWRILKDLGVVNIQVKLDNVGRKEAMFRTIELNKFRGSLDSVKLAQVLSELKDFYDVTEISDILGYTEEELKSFDDLLNFDMSAIDNASEGDLPDGELIKEDDLKLNNEFKVDLSLYELDIVETALGKLSADKKEALVKLCSEHLRMNYPTDLQTIEDRKKQYEQAELDAKYGDEE